MDYGLIDRTTLPLNLAYLSINDGWWVWIIRECVVCGEEHMHNGGELDSDPNGLLEHRAAHCTWAGYLVYDGDPEATSRLMAERDSALPVRQDWRHHSMWRPCSKPTRRSGSVPMKGRCTRGTTPLIPVIYGGDAELMERSSRNRSRSIRYGGQSRGDLKRQSMEIRVGKSKRSASREGGKTATTPAWRRYEYTTEADVRR